MHISILDETVVKKSPKRHPHLIMNFAKIYTKCYCEHVNRDVHYSSSKSFFFLIVHSLIYIKNIEALSLSLQLSITHEGHGKVVVDRSWVWVFGAKSWICENGNGVVRGVAGHLVAVNSLLFVFSFF